MHIIYIYIGGTTKFLIYLDTYSMLIETVKRSYCVQSEVFKFRIDSNKLLSAVSRVRVVFQ